MAHEQSLFDLPRLRPRAAGSREPLRLLYVVVGHGVAHAASVATQIHDASRGVIRVEPVVGLGRALDHLRDRPAPLVLLQAEDVDLARVALAEIKLAHPAVPVVLLTEADDDEAAVDAVRAGAEDCLSRAAATGPRLVRAMRCALERTSHAATLRTQAVTDPLTGLPNRHALQKSIDHAIAMARRKGRALAVLFVDLDGFKHVNDADGHEQGDRVLQEIARRFAGRTRDMDTVARIGGDEFVVVMEDLDDGRFAATLAAKLLAAAAEPIVHGGRATELTASVGISLFPGDGDDAAALVRHADIAMYAAKTAGKNQYRYYRARMNEHSRAKTVLDAALDRAFDNDEFELHYQPVWQASRRGISSCEALLRWRRPGHGLLLPGAFLESADEAGLAGRLAQWVLTRAGAATQPHARVRLRGPGVGQPVAPPAGRRRRRDLRAPPARRRHAGCGAPDRDRGIGARLRGLARPPGAGRTGAARHRCHRRRLRQRRVVAAGAATRQARQHQARRRARRASCPRGRRPRPSSAPWSRWRAHSRFTWWPRASRPKRSPAGCARSAATISRATTTATRCPTTSG